MAFPLSNALRCVVLCGGLLAAAAPTAAVADVTVVAHAASAGADGTLALRTARPVTSTVRLVEPGTAVTVKARGSACAGAPVLAVSVDGATRRTKRLSGGRAQTLTVAQPLATGSHRIMVALANAHAAHGCRRSITVDRMVVRTKAASPSAAAPAASPAPSPAPATSAPAATAPAASAPAPATPRPVAPTPDPPIVPDPPTVSVAPTAPDAGASTPAPPVDTRAKLTWAPPALSSPTTINVAQGDQVVNLDTSKDYVINLGATPHAGSLSLVGGHDVVLIGGRIGLPALSTKSVALMIKNATGTVHVEGVEFDGTSGREMDAIQIVAPQAIVQVENVRADHLLGTYDTNHSDVIQPYGGVAQLRVDRLSADSNYQGIFTRPDLGPIGSVDLRHVDMAFNNAAAGSTGGYLLWMTTGCDMAPTTLSDVYLQPRAGRTLATAVWPTTTDAGCPARVTGSQATWPGLPITGSVTAGVPAGGSYVPAGSVGPGYVSPGYR